MPDGILNLPFQVSTADGHNVNLLVAPEWSWRGRNYRGVVGASSDGASTPRPGWAALPPFGWYWPECVIHDLLYRCMAEIQNPDGSWLRIQMPFQDCNQCLLDLMTAHQPTGEVYNVEKMTIYQAVSKDGQGSYWGDLAAPIVIPPPV